MWKTAKWNISDLWRKRRNLYLGAKTFQRGSIKHKSDIQHDRVQSSWPLWWCPYAPCTEPFAPESPAAGVHGPQCWQRIVVDGYSAFWSHQCCCLHLVSISFMFLLLTRTTSERCGVRLDTFSPFKLWFWRVKIQMSMSQCSEGQHVQPEDK